MIIIIFLFFCVSQCIFALAHFNRALSVLEPCSDRISASKETFISAQDQIPPKYCTYEMVHNR